MQHEKYIRRCIELAKCGLGLVSPNPLVGAVIVKNNEIISEGYHQMFGSAHAEVNAIMDAKIDNFEDCILYVNLEPCNHTGKTPPCTELLIQKGIKKVVIAMEDPNPLVAGQGIARLREAGIEVITDILKEEAGFLNRFFIKNQNEKRAYSILKIAQSIDGCMAQKDGFSKWITNEESRTYTHKLRSEIDAVLVGKNTILKDNPILNSRMVDGRNPKKIALDTRLNLPLDQEIFKNDDRANTIIVCSNECENSRKANILRLGGIKVLCVNTNKNDNIDLKETLEKLYSEFNIGSVLIEGGPFIHSSFIENDLADELHTFTAPIIMGDCKKSFNNYHPKSISNSAKFELIELNKLGNDIHAFYLKK